MLFLVDGKGVPSVSRFVQVVSHFGQRTVLAGAIPDTKGLATHAVSGSLVRGSRVSFDLRNGPPGGSGLLVIGTARLDLPLFGGLLVPRADVIAPVPSISATGAAGLGFTFPPGVPTGSTAYSQFWFFDKGAAQGIAATNGLRIVTP